MELIHTREVGEYFTYDGAKAYKFCFNKFVTNTGKIYTLFKGTAPKEIAVSTSSANGYRTFKYRESSYGLNIHTSVHQIVAKAFIDNPDNYEVVDHINEDKTDNRVENLRWTTVKGNNDYYNFKDDRKLQETKKLNKELNLQNKKLKGLIAELRKEKEELIALQAKTIDKLSKALEDCKADIDVYAKRNMPEDKFIEKVKDSTDRKFGSVEDMIKEVGKEVYVDNTRFNSIREATRYITELPECTATSETIRKEIRKLVRGDRPAWYYLGKYHIHLG